MKTSVKCWERTNVVCCRFHLPMHNGDNRDPRERDRLRRERRLAR